MGTCGIENDSVLLKQLGNIWDNGVLTPQDKEDLLSRAGLNLTLANKRWRNLSCAQKKLLLQVAQESKYI